MNGPLENHENGDECRGWPDESGDWYTDDQGMVMAEKAFPRKSVEACIQFRFQEDDCLIASYPKAGNELFLFSLQFSAFELIL